jgi:hypothetical protein
MKGPRCPRQNPPRPGSALSATPVRLPGPRGEDLRRILLDIRDLDRLIDEGKA